MTRRARLWISVTALSASGCVVGSVGEYRNLAPGIDLPTVDSGSGGAAGTGGSSAGTGGAGPGLGGAGGEAALLGGAGPEGEELPLGGAGGAEP